METVCNKTEGKAKSKIGRRCENDLRKMGVSNWKQTTQERKKWKEIIEQAKTHKEFLELKKKEKMKDDFWYPSRWLRRSKQE